MSERGRFFGIARNLTVAAAIIPLSASSGHVHQEQMESEPTRIEAVQQDLKNNNDSFLNQLDEYLETDYGRAIAASLFIFSIANASYRFQKSLELDSKRKMAESTAASALLISLSLNFLVQTKTEVDPRITMVIIDAFTFFNSAYLVESTHEADRHWSKKIPSFTAVASLIAISSLISLDTIDKS